MQTSKITGLARILKIVTVLAMIAVILLAVFLVAFMASAAFIQDREIVTSLLAIDNVVGVTMEVLSLGFAVLALDRLRRLFGCYIAGEIVTPHTALLIRGAGIALFWSALLELFVEPVFWLSSRLTSAPASFSDVEIGTAQFGYLFAAGTLTVIGWAMSEAARMAEENKAFV